MKNLEAVSPPNQASALVDSLGAMSQAAARSLQTAAHSLQTAALQFLIVEDAEDDYILITHELSRLSSPFQTKRIDTREALIASLNEQTWDIVISDHNLPQLHSASVLQILRQFAPHTPLILVTGAQAENSILTLALEGADDYIFKHHLARLVPSVNRTLRIKQAQQEQMRAQRALHTSLQQLQTLVAAAPLGIIACDAEGKITLWNETASRILGYQATDMLGQAAQHTPLHDSRMLLFSRLQILYQDLLQAFSQDPAQTSTKLAALVERQDGALLDIEIQAALLIDDPGTQEIKHEITHSRNDKTKGAPQGMVLVVNDLTDLHITERARHESEARFSAVSGNLPGAAFQMWFNSPQRSLRMTALTEGAQQLFNCPAQTLVEHPELFLSHLPNEDRNSLLYELVQCTERQSVIRWEGRIQPSASHPSDPSHTPRWIYIAASPRKLNPETTQWDGIMIDLSEQKEMEHKLRRSEEELRALAANVEKAKEEERAFVAREVHDDIGGTLSKLKADVALLRKALGPECAPAIQARLTDMDQLLDHTVEGTRRIARALRPGILDYGVIPALEWQAGDFGERTSIKTHFFSNQEEVTLDAEQSTALFRIVQESLTNILKYAEASEVFIEVFVEPADINIEVRDNGCGMAADAVDKQQSFGIRGMRERALALGGWLDINSAPGKGTTVMLSIPLQRRIERRKRPRTDKPKDI